MNGKPAIRQRGVSTPETDAAIETARKAAFRLWGANGWLKRGVWLPEQAAWLLAGVDPDAGSSVSEVTAGLRDYIAKLAQSFPVMRGEQPPAKWLEWGACAGIPVPAEFQASMPETVNEGELTTPERGSLLRILYGMACAKPYLYDPTAARNDATATIASATAAAGCEVNADTVRKYLKEAAERFGIARRAGR